MSTLITLTWPDLTYSQPLWTLWYQRFRLDSNDLCRVAVKPAGHVGNIYREVIQRIHAVSPPVDGARVLAEHPLYRRHQLLPVLQVNQSKLPISSCAGKPPQLLNGKVWELYVELRHWRLANPICCGDFSWGVWQFSGLTECVHFEGW